MPADAKWPAELDHSVDEGSFSELTATPARHEAGELGPPSRYWHAGWPACRLRPGLSIRGGTLASKVGDSISWIAPSPCEIWIIVL